MNSAIPTRLLLVVVMSLLACGRAGADREPLVFGVHPYLPASELAERFAPLLHHLEKVLGVESELRIGGTYESHFEGIVRGDVDLAFVGPFVYINLLNRDSEWPVAARMSFSGETHFRGAIVVRDDSPISSLAELKGRRFALGDPMSTLGSVVPTAMLRQSGVELDDLARHRHLNNHDSVALGVLMGYYDAGGVKGEVYQAYVDQGLRAIAFSPWISTHLFVFGRQVPAELRSRLREELLGLHRRPEAASILTSIKPGTTALVPVAASDYDSLRELLRAHGLHLHR